MRHARRSSLMELDNLLTVDEVRTEFKTPQQSRRGRRRCL